MQPHPIPKPGPGDPNINCEFTLHWQRKGRPSAAMALATTTPVGGARWAYRKQDGGIQKGLVPPNMGVDVRRMVGDFLTGEWGGEGFFFSGTEPLPAPVSGADLPSAATVRLVHNGAMILAFKEHESGILLAQAVARLSASDTNVIDLVDAAMQAGAWRAKDLKDPTTRDSIVRFNNTLRAHDTLLGSGHIRFDRYDHLMDIYRGTFADTRAQRRAAAREAGTTRWGSGRLKVISSTNPLVVGPDDSIETMLIDDVVSAARYAASEGTKR